MMSLKDLILKRFGSFSEMGRKLHQVLSDKQIPDLPKPSALATYAGQLCGGDPTWFRNHPSASAELARLLRISTRELLGSVGPPPGALAFSEFPDLEPLGPDEAPCGLWGGDWLLDLVIRPRRDTTPRLRWLQARAGMGKTLAIRQAARHPELGWAAHTVGYLEDALPFRAQSGDRPLLLEVECAADRPSRDLQALSVLASAGPTVILAAFSPPVGIKAGKVEPDPAWRGPFLAWVERRLHDGPAKSRFVAADLERWLEEHDPQGLLVGTPGDLLALASVFHAHGTSGDRFANLAARWLREVAPVSLPAEAPEVWRNRVAVPTVEALCQAHLLQTRSEWGALPLSGWAELLPDALSPADGASGPGRAVAASYLASGGLLRAGPVGLTPYPTWVGEGLARAALQKWFLEREPRDWGALAADASRKPIVGRALNAMGGAAFRRLTDRVSQEHPATLAQVGAVESTLASAIHRYAPADRIPEEAQASLSRLVRKQIGLLRMAEYHRQVQAPFTWVGREDPWLVDAWWLSLRLPRPDNLELDGLEWVFPGWCERLPLTNDVPWLRIEASEAGGDTLQDRLFSLWAELTPRLSPDPGPLPDSLPPGLVVGLLLFPRAEIPLWPPHLASLTQNPGGIPAERFLLRRARELSAEAGGDLAGRIWDLLDGEKYRPTLAGRLSLLGRHEPALATWVLEHLPEERVGRTIEERGLFQPHVEGETAEALVQLPERLLRPALQAWARSDRESGRRLLEATELARLFTPQEIDLVLELIREVPANEADPLTRAAWALDEPMAREEALAALVRDEDRARAWYFTSPRVAWSALVEALPAAGRRPSWVARWAARAALSGGEVAEALYALAREGARG